MHIPTVGPSKHNALVLSRDFFGAEIHVPAPALTQEIADIGIDLTDGSGDNGLAFLVVDRNGLQHRQHMYLWRGCGYEADTALMANAAEMAVWRAYKDRYKDECASARNKTIGAAMGFEIRSRLIQGRAGSPARPHR